MSDPTPKSAELVVLELRAELASSEAEVARLRGLLREVPASLAHGYDSVAANLLARIDAALVEHSETRKNVTYQRGETDVVRDQSVPGGSQVTDEQIAEIERLADEATRGTWVAAHEGVDDGNSTTWCVDAHGVGELGLTVEIAKMSNGGDREDAEFIAEARTAVPALIAALRECRAERDKWIEDARRDNANRDYWKERAEAAESALAAVTTERDEASANVNELVDLLRDIRRVADRYSVISIVNDIDDTLGEKGWLRDG